MSSIRIANASGFYGDRDGAFRELLEGGPVDVITGDYLAELTMLILARDRARDPSLGYARTVIGQLDDCLGLALERGVRIVVNAGGLNPSGLADGLRGLCSRLGLAARIAHVEGDDLLPRAGELGLGSPPDPPLAANAYLGGFGIAACLRAGADVVVTGRVTDASLVVGPAAAHFGWQPTAFDALAGAMAAGHVIECGAQATGGNYAFFDRIPDLGRPGFPIAEVHPDGSSVITKHPGTGGSVTVGTVTAQLVYEVTGARYAGPDAVLRLDSIRLTGDGPDRVRIDGVRGEPPPDTLAVSVTQLGGYRNEVTFVLTGLDIEAKADLVRRQLAGAVPAGTTWTLARTDHEDAPTQESASALLHCVARSLNPTTVGRAFSNAAVQLALASYPGFHLTAPPGEASPYGVHRRGSVPAEQVQQVAVLPDGTRMPIPPAPGAVAADIALAPLPQPEPPARTPAGPTRRVPLGRIVAARSGDKGGDANLGVWVEDERAWPWLVHTLTVDTLRALLPEVAGLPVERYVLADLGALNFVVHGLLGAGVAVQRPVRPAGQGAGRMAALPARRHSRGAAVSVLRTRVDPASADHAANREAMLVALAELDAEHSKALAAGGQASIERHHRRGKLLPRERIELLVDQDSPFLELSPLAAWGTEYPLGASVVTGIGVVQGVECMIVANDPTVRGGASNPWTVRKIFRANDIARQNRLPVFSLVESGGADLPSQKDIFIPGGRLFRDLTQLSAAGIPTVALVFGNSTAGGAYIPGMSDHVVMVKERAKVFLAGPPLVRMATGEVSDDESLGGADMHARTSGLADHYAVDERDAIRIGRRIAARLNHRKAGPEPVAVPRDPRHPEEDLLGIVPADLTVGFDPREVIARIADDSDFDEFKPLYGSSLVTGWAQLHGYPIGILANARGVLFSAESQKAAQFIQLANSARTPLLFLHNTTGYMVGAQYEQGGIIKHGAMMINAVANSTVPHLSVLIGASFGAGHYGMCGRAFDPRFLFAWPSARSAVMGPQQLAGVLSIVSRAAAAAAGRTVDEDADATMRTAVERQIDAESLPMFLSGRIYDDGIIDPRDTRTVLGLALSVIAGAPEAAPAGYGVFRM